MTPRVAFFPDSFDEVNGVAHTARQFTGWAARTGKPFLCVYAGQGSSQQGSAQLLGFPRGRFSFTLDRDLRWDPLWAHHGPAIGRALRRFRPDLIHITGPSEVGMLGAVLAHRLGVPLVASWHTNIHEYAARRSQRLLRVLPPSLRPRASLALEQAALRGLARFYGTARLLFAPNPELCALLTRLTGHPCLPMSRGVDVELFSPARRTAPSYEESRRWTLGYVGRVSVEKNVMLLPRIAAVLRARGFRNVRFLLVGQGVDEQTLRLALPEGHFAGVLRGEALAEAYANMDLFVFPSHTDTFGNVVLEAMASGVPAVVTPDGGPAHLVRASDGGVVAEDDAFADAIAGLLGDPDERRAMGERARHHAAGASWDAVFNAVYAGYAGVLGT